MKLRRHLLSLLALAAGIGGGALRVGVQGDRDPGYGSTAKMLGEAVACLALDVSKDEVAGGFWTPATAMGDRLITRLQAHAGLTFDVLG